jgi:hypothetical protein
MRAVSQQATVFERDGLAWMRGSSPRMTRALRAQSRPLRHLAQLEFLNLPGAGLRDLRKHDVARAFVGGEVGAAPGDELLGGGAGAGL